MNNKWAGKPAHHDKLLKGGLFMDIKELRVISGMTRLQFAEYFGIPYRTLQNWELGLRECPEYLLKLLEFRLVFELRDR